MKRLALFILCVLLSTLTALAQNEPRKPQKPIEEPAYTLTKTKLPNRTGVNLKAFVIKQPDILKSSLIVPPDMMKIQAEIYQPIDPQEMKEVPSLYKELVVDHELKALRVAEKNNVKEIVSRAKGRNDLQADRDIEAMKIALREQYLQKRVEKLTALNADGEKIAETNQALENHRVFKNRNQQVEK